MRMVRRTCLNEKVVIKKTTGGFKYKKKHLFFLFLPKAVFEHVYISTGVKPFIDNTSVLVSDSTVYAVKADENEPYGPCAPGAICHTCVKRQNWVIYWTPLTGMAGLEVSSVLTDHETLTTRCCLGTSCGNCCCPMLQGKVKLSLWCNGVTVQVTDLSKHEALRDKPQVVAFRRGVAQVQGGMMTSTFHKLINRMT
jgi:hypothetical protein